MPTRVPAGHLEWRSPVTPGVGRRPRGRGGKGLPPYGLGLTPRSCSSGLAQATPGLVAEHRHPGIDDLQASSSAGPRGGRVECNSTIPGTALRAPDPSVGIPMPTRVPAGHPGFDLATPLPRCRACVRRSAPRGDMATRAPRPNPSVACGPHRQAAGSGPILLRCLIRILADRMRVRRYVRTGCPSASAVFEPRSGS
jgi:hypothetical protein